MINEAECLYSEEVKHFPSYIHVHFSRLVRGIPDSDTVPSSGLMGVLQAACDISLVLECMNQE